MRFPGESPEYRAARDRLKEREIEVRRLMETLASERRALPPGGVVPEDYVFEQPGTNGLGEKVKLSQLFGAKDTLAIYSYMFGPEREKPCNMCTPMLDGLNGAEDHIRQRMSFFVVAESPASRLWKFARERPWLRLQLISAAGNTYNRDYHGKTSDGDDTTMLNVFRREGKVIRHFWGTELAHGPSDAGQDHRGLDLLNLAFQAFDLTPEGRGDWYTKLEYD